MATITKTIEKRSYNLLGALEDEIDALESFFEYDGGTYICDAISEIGDRFIPVYNNNVWKDAPSIQEYIEEAIAQGLVHVEGNNIDLVRIFQSGYYQYYTQSLYDNLDTLAYNYVVNGVNEALSTLNRETLEEIDVSAIEDEIDAKTDGQDNNDTYSNLDEIVNEIVNDINEGGFAS